MLKFHFLFSLLPKLKIATLIQITTTKKHKTITLKYLQTTIQKRNE